MVGSNPKSVFAQTAPHKILYRLAYLYNVGLLLYGVNFLQDFFLYKLKGVHLSLTLIGMYAIIALSGYQLYSKLKLLTYYSLKK